MRISTRGRYALRMMIDLAQHAGGEPVARSDLVCRQKISADYTAQLFRQLSAAGLVVGVRGPGGGYILARDATEIRVGDVIRAVEGPIEMVHCVSHDPESTCKRIDFCEAHLLWTELGTLMAKFLDSITLQDLCDPAWQLKWKEEQHDAWNLPGYH